MPTATKSPATDKKREELHHVYETLAAPLADAQAQLATAEAEVSRLRTRREELLLAILDAERCLATLQDQLSQALIAASGPIALEPISANVGGLPTTIEELKRTESVLTTLHLKRANIAVTQAEIDATRAAIRRLEARCALHDFELSLSLANVAILDGTLDVTTKNGLSEQLAAAVNDHKTKLADLQAKLETEKNALRL
ncbi:MAG: hypothetical protein WA324_19920 [Bryobacteraceae bacterium]